MNSRVTNAFLFRESQQIRQGWIWLVMILGYAFAIAMILTQVPITDAESARAKSIGVVTILFTGFIAFGLMYFLRLDTAVDEQGLYVRFAPFERRFRIYHWGEIQHAGVRKFPIHHVGKLGKLSKSKSYSMGTRMGLQLYMKNGARIFVSSQKIHRLRDAVSRFIEVNDETKSRK